MAKSNTRLVHLIILTNQIYFPPNCFSFQSYLTILVILLEAYFLITRLGMSTGQPTKFRVSPIRLRAIRFGLVEIFFYFLLLGSNYFDILNTTFSLFPSILRIYELLINHLHTCSMSQKSTNK